jgi:GGDEF domain-containing protein
VWEDTALKVFMRTGNQSPADYVRLLQKTLAEIAGGPPDTDVQAVRLRTGLSAISSRITEQATLEELEKAVSAATDLICKYHATAGERALAQIAELKSVMRTMTDTITFLSESRSTVVHQLTFVERQLEEASELEDIRLLRPRLTECLELVRQETARLLAESEAHSAAVRNQMGVAVVSAASTSAGARKLGTLDIATGLPNRAAAERLLGEKIAQGQRCSLALFVPERLGFISRRHGREAEEEVLLHVAQHLTKLLPQGSWLYRWTGPALAAIRVSTDTPEHSEQIWRHISGKAYEKTIGNERRSALLRITLACLVRNVEAGISLPEALKQMDDFVAENTRE